MKTFKDLVERLGGRGISRLAAKASLHPPSRKGDGQFDNQDRGAGNKAKRRAGEKIKRRSPTYLAYIQNKDIDNDVEG